MHVKAVVTAVTVLAAVTTLGCGGRGDSPTSPSAASSEAALAYLGEVLGLMQAHSLARHRIDWSDFRSRVLAEGAAARSISDTRSGVLLALQLLGDRHSFIQASNGTTLVRAGGSCAPSERTEPRLPEDVGYVWVPGFTGSSGAASAQAYAEAVHARLARMDRDDLAGWVVDLRGNTGGNMWPMVAGAGPILGEGVAGHFIDADGGVTAWGYFDGAAVLDGRVMVRVPTPHRRLSRSNRVAVLTDGHVGSSGEAAVIAFVGRANTRSFGLATCGLSTANQGFPLSDGSMLVLTTAVMADRERSPYGGPVVPDEIIANAGEVFDRAVTWLRGAR